ncbi:MAG: rhodanese-like domain-containing protein [Verrucomicrobia bacterium]|nr:rhodanese-like domain-containing protein [Verrucomicrobiota bacterium]
MTAGAMRRSAAALVLVALSCNGPQGSGPAPARTAPAAPRPTQATAVPVTPKPGKIARMPLGTFFALQQSAGALIYDVRPAFFFSLGHIPGASSWPKRQFAAQLAAREAEILLAAAAKRPVVLYCTDLACPDADFVARRLAACGHSVAILEGGYQIWKAGELPTE